LPFIAIFGFLLIELWIAVQASPWTPKAWHHPVWFASPLLANAKSTISADPSLTWQALGWWSTLSVFVVAVRFGTDARRSIFVLKLMLSICVLVALFGFIVERFELNTLGLVPKVYYRGWLTGTFVSRNSAASFIGIGLILALALASREYLAHQSQSVWLANFVVSRAGLYGAGALILFLALLLTGSRGGIATGIVGGFLVLVMSVVKRNRLNASVIAALLGGLTISIALAVSMLQYRTETAESTDARLSLYAEALRAIADRPILGHGAGAFSSIQPLYHSSSTPSNLIWDNAHSTVLEVIVTLGIPAVMFAIVILGYILFNLAQTWWYTCREATCLLVILTVAVAVSLHAFVDFSLEIQAIALYVACLVGLGIGEMISLNAQRSERDQSRSVPSSIAPLTSA
jgi:O-antigen ligase